MEDKNYPDRCRLMSTGDDEAYRERVSALLRDGYRIISAVPDANGRVFGWCFVTNRSSRS